MYLQITKYQVTNIEKYYFEWHDKIFGQDPYHHPTIVYLAHDDKNEFVGFYSGYYHDRRTFYIQKLAINPKLKGQGLGVELALKIWKHMKEKGKVRYLLGQVETTNIPTLLIALKTGWAINGYLTDTNNTPYVRIILDLGAT